MIRRWRNRFILYLLIAAFIAIIGVYFYINMKQSNDNIALLREKGVTAKVEMKQLAGAIYDGNGTFYWGYDLPDDVPHNRPETGFDASTITTYTLEQYRENGHMLDVVYYVFDDGSYITYDSDYVESYKPFDYFESIFLWSLAGVSFLIAAYYVGRNILWMVVAAKGEEYLGRFEEAYHTKFGSNKYYAVKFTYSVGGDIVTASTPAVYESREAEKLKNYGTFIVKVRGKIVVIDQKL